MAGMATGEAAVNAGSGSAALMAASAGIIAFGGDNLRAGILHVVPLSCRLEGGCAALGDASCHSTAGCCMCSTRVDDDKRRGEHGEQREAAQRDHEGSLRNSHGKIRPFV